MMFSLSFVEGSKSAENPLADLDRGVQILGGPNPLGHPAFQERNRGWNTQSHSNLCFPWSGKHFKSLNSHKNVKFFSPFYELLILIRYINSFWSQFVEPAKHMHMAREKFAQSRHAIYQAGFVQLILMVAGKCRVCRSKPLWSIRA